MPFERVRPLPVLQGVIEFKCVHTPMVAQISGCRIIHMEDSPEAPEVVSPTTALRALLTEYHEMFLELCSVGFTEKQATSIIAHMVESAMAFREEEDDDAFDEDDDEDGIYDDDGDDD